MAITVTETQVEWAAADSKVVAFADSELSDAFVINQTCFQAMIQLKADNDGAPAAGDSVDFYLQATLGDPDGAGASEYGTEEQDIPLGSLDTNADDPAIASVQLPVPLVGGKIFAVNKSAGRAITVSATILEQRG